MSNIVTGLDIGSFQIKGVVAERKKDGSLSLVSAFKGPSSGFRKGVLVDDEEAASAIREVIVDLGKISKKAAQNIFVNVNGDYIKSRSSRGIAAVARAEGKIHHDDIERVIQASRAIKLSPNYTILHNITREYFVDEIGDIFDPLGMSGNRLEVSTLIIETFAPQINTFLKIFQRVGGSIGGFIFNPLAASRAVLSKRQKDLGVLLIDIGFGTTSMAVYEENKAMYAKSLPVGSGYVTNDIAIGLKTSIDAAEKLKLTYGVALAKEIPRREIIKLEEVEDSNKNEITRRFLAEIIEIRLAEIFDLINNELKSVGQPTHLPAGAVLVGGGAKLAGMVELAKQELKLPAQIGFPDIKNFNIMNPAHKEMIDDPEFATAVGLVFWGVGEGKEQRGGMNLIKNFFKNLIP